MKTMVRLTIAAMLLSGTAGTSLVAYFAGYADGLRVQAATAVPSRVVVTDLPVEAKLSSMHVMVEE